MDKLPLLLVLDNIRSLHNVGAILRSAEAAHVQEVLFAGITPTPPRHEIDKTALGALANLKWRYLADLRPFLSECKAKGIPIIALEQNERSTNLFDFTFTFPSLLIVGHEREGVQPEILKVADTILEIPLQGKAVKSLNVSNATSIALYEAVRQFWYHK